MPSPSFVREIKQQVEKNFKLHANGLGLHGYTTWDILVSKVGLSNMVDASVRALRSTTDTYSRKFRSGIRIDFYNY